jgi:hypothetical protein
VRRARGRGEEKIPSKCQPVLSCALPGVAGLLLAALREWRARRAPDVIDVGLALAMAAEIKHFHDREAPDDEPGLLLSRKSAIADSSQPRRLSAGLSREWPQAIAGGDAERSRRVPADAG